ncbi:MarR family winged helix-turn-helix transcriptional regulator [Exiguobacterium oxidotolerans]|uniref:HTH marR-type domain-containing protein n=1 Tax=Exiguobacterium oxidotolerans TaxID=223958 RepID=A0A653IHW8_9BACL|nr:MarR family transcriptional regulator [Exiguobacterium oxidotolerans]VWX38756.1 conserved hypothetical protein [Exiguobacterium oxidotolerans]
MNPHAAFSSIGHWQSIQRIHNRYVKEVNDTLKQWELSRSQFDMLYTLYQLESATQKSLETTLELSSGSISQTLKKLMQNRLLTRKRIDREKRIVLTADGETLVQASAPIIEVIDERYFQSFTKNDHQTFNQLLNKMQNSQF